MKIEVECFQVIDKEIKAQTNAGVIYVPKAWIGKRARVLLLDPLTKSESE